MKKMLSGLAALSALVVIGLTAGSASAVTVPTGYAPDPDIELEIDIDLPGGILYGGDIVPIKVHASHDGEPLVCTSMTVSSTPGLVESFNGGGESTYDLKLNTEVVQQQTPTTIRAVCTYAPLQASGGPGDGFAASGDIPAANAANSVSATNTVILLPRDGATNAGFLPKTGTEIGLWLLAAGGVLILGGGAVLVLRRRAQN